MELQETVSQSVSLGLGFTCSGDNTGPGSMDAEDVIPVAPEVRPGDVWAYRLSKLEERIHREISPLGPITKHSLAAIVGVSYATVIDWFHKDYLTGDGYRGILLRPTYKKLHTLYFQGKLRNRQGDDIGRYATKAGSSPVIEALREPQVTEEKVIQDLKTQVRGVDLDEVHGRAARAAIRAYREIILDAADRAGEIGDVRTQVKLLKDFIHAESGMQMIFELEET